MLSFGKDDFIGWSEYERKANFYSDFHFQQETRRRSLKNSGFF